MADVERDERCRRYREAERCRVAPLAEARQSLHRWSGTAVAREQGERAFVAFRREGGTGIRHADRPVAAVRVPDRMVDALIGEQTGDDQMLDPEIAEQIVAVGRVEEAR